MAPTVQNAEPFRYEPLDLEGRSTRLLSLYQQGSSPGLECDLFEVSLEDDWFEYEALSYTWGSTDLTEPITVNGRILYITENLYNALVNLQLESTARIIWIDAVCIDQQNLKERGHQVQQMGQIYSRADRVIFWLSTGGFEIDALMDCLTQLQKASIQHASNNWTRTDARWRDLWTAAKYLLRFRYPSLEHDLTVGLKMLLDRDWFKRVWILQEVAKAKTALLCAGTKSISARIFALAPELVELKPEPHC